MDTPYAIPGEEPEGWTPNTEQEGEEQGETEDQGEQTEDAGGEDSPEPVREDLGPDATIEG
jgi:hypothetical protein